MLPSLLHESEVQRAHIHWIYRGSQQEGQTTQQGTQGRWRVEDQHQRPMFEWAWQHPDKSRRLGHVEKKNRKESRFEFAFRVVSHMLRVGPWTRLPLTVQWLMEEYRLDFQTSLAPPPHMAIAYGPVKAVCSHAQRSIEQDDIQVMPLCCVCNTAIQSRKSTARCIHPGCTATSHLSCLAKLFLQGDSKSLIPVNGDCPRCGKWTLWGELVRHSRTCDWF
ncbi:structure-specific endonuclease subunit slx1 isoform X2 [Ixodes scapularis]|uniref:structure-specific endonuclease subunit slx1 isoform X2 n=1 Tax=Ixodes scapularis TaxID=6945 RepID=UPI001C38CF48|nr:structure-specific endonuclease subunit slx1 isoform X2 [Ixodes scapularis]